MRADDVFCYFKKAKNTGVLGINIKIKCAFWQSPNKAKERLGSKYGH